MLQRGINKNQKIREDQSIHTKLYIPLNVCCSFSPAQAKLTQDSALLLALRLSSPTKCSLVSSELSSSVAGRNVVVTCGARSKGGLQAV